MIHPYILVGIIFLFSGFAAGLAGFGAIMIALPLMALFLDVKTAIPVAILASVFVHLIVLFQLRQYFEWKKLMPLLVGAVPGALIGVYFLKQLHAGAIHLILGLILIAYSLYALVSRKPAKGIKERWAYLFGFIAGGLGAAVGATGPAVIAYTSLQPWSKDLIKATLQGFFIAAGILVAGLHAASGLTTVKVLSLFAAGMPGLIVGSLLGSKVYDTIIRGDIYRRLILVFLLILGLLMIYRAW